METRLFDEERFRSLRAAFPILERRAYLFAGGLAPLSTPSRAALEEYAELSSSDPVTAYGDVPRVEAERLRETVAPLIGAGTDELAIVDGTSRGNNLAVQLVEAPPGSNVVVDPTTYPSALFPWLLPARSHVEVRQVGADVRGLPLLDDFPRLVDDRTVAVSISHVCRLTGFRHDLRSLAGLAHAHGAALLVDAAQSVGAVPVDVGRDGVDALSFGAMKWLLGTPGVAFFYASQGLCRAPLVQAGLAGASLSGGRVEPAPGARRFELGSGSWGGLAASRCGAELAGAQAPEAVERGVLALSGLLVEGLAERGHLVRTPTDPARRAGIVAFEHGSPDALRRHLRSLGVDVWAWEARGVVRADPHVYNVPDDVDRFLAGVDAFGR